jgi:ligand-binding sensor domain-containing protein
MELYAMFFAGSYRGHTKREVGVYNPTVEIDVTTNKSEYFSEEEVLINLNITNMMSYNFDLNVSVRVFDPTFSEILNTIFSIHLPNASSSNGTIKLQLPALAKDGRYVIFAEQINRITTRRVNSASKSHHFSVAPYKLEVTSRSAPEVFYPNSNATIIFPVKNVGKQDVPDGTINVTFFDPEDNLLWMEEQIFGLISVNESQIFTFNIPIGELGLGGYNIFYKINYGPGKRTIGSISVISSLFVQFNLNKKYYRTGDNFNLTLKIINAGNTYQNKTFRLEIPDLGFNTTESLDLLPRETFTLISEIITLPMDIEANQHEILLYLQYDSGEPTNRHYFTIPEPGIAVNLMHTRYEINEDIEFFVRNTGGVNASINCQLTLMNSVGEKIVDRLFSEVLIPGGSSVWDLSIPGFLPSGIYLFHAVTTELTTNTTQPYTMTLWIDGLSLDLTVKTERDIYNKTDPIRILNQIDNSLRDLYNGTLHLEISKLMAENGESTWTYYQNPLPYYVNAIEFDDNGTMWVGTRDGGIIRIHGDTWIKYKSETGLIAGSIEVLYLDAEGQVWVANPSATHKRGVSVFNGTTWTRYSEYDSGLVSDYVKTIASHSNGSVWFGTYYGASHFNGIDWTTYNTSNSGLSDDYIYDITTDPNGNVWFATDKGATYFNGSHWTVYNTTNSGIGNNLVYAISVHPNESVWFGVNDDVSMFNGSHWTTFTSSDGLGTGRIRTIELDQSGKVFVGTTRGISVFNGSSWITYDETNSGLADEYINTISFGPSGKTWVGHYGSGYGVSFFNGTDWKKWIPSIISNDVNGITFDQSQKVWIATAEGVSVYEGTQWVHYTTENSGLLNNDVLSIATDSFGDVWFGHYCSWPDCGVSRFNGSDWTNYTFDNVGLYFDRIYSIVPTASSNIWFGTGGSGVYKYDGANWTVYDTSNSGIPSDYAYLIAVDDSETLWVGTGLGVSRFDGTFWVTYNSSNSNLPFNDVTGIAVDSDNNVWVTLNHYLYQVSMFNGTGWTSYSSPSEPLEGSLTNDFSNKIWFGTDEGAIQFNGFTWRIYNTTNSGILQSPSGRSTFLWMF